MVRPNMKNKRKNIRVVHDDRVQCISDGQIFTGTSINISKTGMQLMIKLPRTYREVSSITFTLPRTDKPFEIPCQLVCKKRSDKDEEIYILGIEFNYQTESQMVLVENFIKEMKENQVHQGIDVDEMRQIPRIPCWITGIETDKKNLVIRSIDNISAEGFLVSFEGELHAHEEINLTFSLPGHAKKMSASGRVLYVVESIFNTMNSAGIMFTKILEMERIRISNFLVEFASGSVMKTIQNKFFTQEINKEYKITDYKKIGSIFNTLSKKDVLVNVLFEQSHKMYSLPVTGFDVRKKLFMISLTPDIQAIGLKEFDPVYVSFYLYAGSYYFKTAIEALSPDALACTVPSLLYRSEKRSYQRKLFGEDNEIFLSFDGTADGQLKGTLVEISRRGFLCEVPFNPSLKTLLKPGHILRYFVNKDLGLDSQGEIRHLLRTYSETGKEVLRIGVESGIKRKAFRFKRFSPSAWRKQKVYRKDFTPRINKEIKSLVVEYRNKEGKKIVGLVNYTRKHAIAPVVILPPAFGKKKETLSPLAVTIITNFRHYNKDIVTIRYDGINRPGESYNEDMCPKRGYEMLHYRISQGLDDLQATLEYVYNNPYFIAEQVIIIAFSMSSLDVRKLMIQQGRKVDCCINVMGVASGQSALSSITGGMDIIGNYKMGIPNGVSGLLGHLIDLDNLARDIIDNKYAYLTDARLDMSAISSPVLWIYGKYDKWVIADEIKDIMSIAAPGRRAVIEIPTGHNLRSSEDAIKTFKLITAAIHDEIYKKPIRPVDPDKENIVRLITYERERFVLTEDFNPDAYWKEYLMGTENNKFGYDFYKNIREFRDFFTLETGLISLNDGEILADMGCGTGIFIENLLHHAVEHRKPIRNTRLVLVDLIQEALDKTKEKCEKLVTSHPSVLPGTFNFNRMNLDPNRLIPVKKFIDNTNLDFNFLRNRVEGLKNIFIDHFLQKDSVRLYALMRGTPLTDETVAWLKENFNSEHCQVIYDFNRAARFLKRNLSINDLIEEKRSVYGKDIQNGNYEKLRTADIIFKTLHFGNNGLELHLAFEDCCFDKIVASLFISYLFNPDDIIRDFFRMLKKGGKVLVSSMKPDSDISVIFTGYIDKVQHFELEDTDIKNRDVNLAAARAMLNEAAALFELEEDGYFKFYSSDELSTMLENAGFAHIKEYSSLGNPPQAVIVTGEKPL